MPHGTTQEAETSVTFVLEGDFSPEDITETTGVVPSRTGLAGELLDNTGSARRSQSIWEIRSTTNELVPVGEQVKSVLQMLEPHWQKLIDLGKRYECGFRVRVYTYEVQGPEVYFEREVLKQVAQLNAHIDLDLYCLAGS